MGFLLDLFKQSAGEGGPHERLVVSSDISGQLINRSGTLNRQALARLAILLPLCCLTGCRSRAQDVDTSESTGQPVVATVQPPLSTSAPGQLAQSEHAGTEAITPPNPTTQEIVLGPDMRVTAPAADVAATATPMPIPTPLPTAAPATLAPSMALAPADIGSWTPVPTAELMAPEPPGGVPSAGPADASVHMLSGVTHVYQKWNNCGPSTILMALSPFGIVLDQLAIAAELKPNSKDTNVSPGELADFARRQGMHARVGVNGNVELVKRLIKAGVPVVAEQWIDVEGRGEMGHYRVLIGFDDVKGEVIVNDSYYGAKRRFGYGQFETMWVPFGGRYVVVYRGEQEAAVRDAIGADWDDAAMLRDARSDAEAAASAEPGNAWRWFALGEARSAQHDDAAAVEAFDRAVAIGLPFRAFWYQFGYYRSLMAIGAFDRVVALADQTLESMKGQNLEESHYWRGMALHSLGREDEARQSFERAVTFNPNFEPARQALAEQ